MPTSPRQSRGLKMATTPRYLAQVSQPKRRMQNSRARYANSTYTPQHNHKRCTVAKGGGVRGEENPNPSSGRFRGRIPRLQRRHNRRRSSSTPNRRDSSKRREWGAGEGGKKLRPSPDHKQPARPH